MANLTAVDTHQDMMTAWGAIQCSDASSTGAADSRGNDSLVKGDTSFGVGYDASSSGDLDTANWDTPERDYSFSEGRRLLFGV